MRYIMDQTATIVLIILIILIVWALWNNSRVERYDNVLRPGQKPQYTYETTYSKHNLF